MNEQVHNDEPVDKMATQVRDEPNVNKTMFQKMNEQISQDYPEFQGLIDIGSCAIHTVHNASGAWIFICYSSIVLLDVKILKKCK